MERAFLLKGVINWVSWTRGDFKDLEPANKLKRKENITVQLLKLGPYRQKSYWRTFVIRDDLNYKEQASFFIFVFLASGHAHEAS